MRRSEKSSLAEIQLAILGGCEGTPDITFSILKTWSACTAEDGGGSYRTWKEFEVENVNLKSVGKLIKLNQNKHNAFYK